jgi:hypothetical protein
MAKATSYKALTTINLPIIDKLIRPGETVEEADLEAAGQSAEEIKALVDGGALGGPDDELDISTIVPDASMPTIQSVVAQAKIAVEEMQAAGDDVPPELQAVADLDYQAVLANEEGSSSDSNA